MEFTLLFFINYILVTLGVVETGYALWKFRKDNPFAIVLRFIGFIAFGITFFVMSQELWTGQPLDIDLLRHAMIFALVYILSGVTYELFGR